MNRIRLLLGTALIAGAVMSVPSPALAKAGDVIRTGDCSGRADWKLKVSPDNGRWQVEFEVDSNRVGQTWRVKIRDNGVLRYRQLHTTTAPSGSFTARTFMRDMAGTDNIVARARNVNSGQLCVAKVSI
jgi:hypothetical protein